MAGNTCVLDDDDDVFSELDALIVDAENEGEDDEDGFFGVAAFPRWGGSRGDDVLGDPGV